VRGARGRFPVNARLRERVAVNLVSGTSGEHSDDWYPPLQRWVHVGRDVCEQSADKRPDVLSGANQWPE